MTTGHDSSVHHGVFDLATEERKRAAIVDGWFRLAEEARERGDFEEVRACESFARQDCTDEELREYLEKVLTYYAELCPAELSEALDAR